MIHESMGQKLQVLLQPSFLGARLRAYACMCTYTHVNIQEMYIYAVCMCVHVYARGGGGGGAGGQAIAMLEQAVECQERAMQLESGAIPITTLLLQRLLFLSTILSR